MTFTIEEWDRGFSPEALEEVAALWNANASNRHAFYPWSGNLLHLQLSLNGRGIGRLLAARADNGELVGFCHLSALNEDGYPNAGDVEIILVDSRYRNLGIGGKLLERGMELLEKLRPRIGFIDALGAWPFGYIYNVLADGSERSGVFLKEVETYRLFRRAGFEPVKKSYVMRANLNENIVPRPQRGCSFHLGKRRERTWLDRVFRGRELWDHEMVDNGGSLLSRAIFGFMEGESRKEKKGVFSLFGVNTPRDKQGKGYAGVNLSHLMKHVAGLGGEVLELHVYADNMPALALYKGLGFQPVAETMMMHKKL